MTQVGTGHDHGLVINHPGQNPGGGFGINVAKNDGQELNCFRAFCRNGT